MEFKIRPVSSNRKDEELPKNTCERFLKDVLKILGSLQYTCTQVHQNAFRLKRSSQFETNSLLCGMSIGA